MTGPWEKYQAPASVPIEDAPWTKYASASPHQAPAPAPPKTSLVDDIKQGVGNLLAGAVRGAGSIGSTLLWPVDKAEDLYYGDRNPSIGDLVTGKQPLSRNEERRQAIDLGLKEMGAQPDSWMYKGGKLAGEVAGTAGAGGLVANGARLAAPALAASPLGTAALDAIASGGFRAGGTTGMQAAALRALGGAANGGMSAGMVDPSSAGAGALIGGTIPGMVGLSGAFGNQVENAGRRWAKVLMQSALKPIRKDLKSGDAATAVDTLLDYGLSPNQAGVDALRDKIGAISGQIRDKISSSPATVNKQAVIDALEGTRKKFGSQVAPQGDLSAIQGIEDSFLTHPAAPLPATEIPVQLAQDMKQATYKVLSKKYGEAGSASTEAQKALARGLKEQIAIAVPEVSALNAEESRLLATLSVAERRALAELNKDPAGLGSLARSPLGFATFMAGRSAAFKAIAARMVNGSARAVGGTTAAIPSGMTSPLLRNGAVLGASDGQ